MGVESEVLVENVGHFHSSSKYSPQYTRGSEMYLTMTARVVCFVILHLRMNCKTSKWFSPIYLITRFIHVRTRDLRYYT